MYALEFVRASEWKQHKDPLRNKFVIEPDRISTLGVYDETIGSRVAGEKYLRPFVNNLGSFEDGIRIAVQRDYGKSNDYRYLEEQYWKMHSRIQKMKQKIMSMRQNPEESDRLTMKMYKLSDQKEKMNPDKRGWKGMSSVCKVVMGSDGRSSDAGLTVRYVRFPIKRNSEVADEKFMRQWIHGTAVKQLAKMARDMDVQFFTMQFSDMDYREFQMKYKRRMKMEADEKEDTRDFMEAENELLFLHTQLRF